MNSYLQTYIEEKDIIDPSRDSLVEDIASMKSRIKKMKDKYKKSTPEEYERQRQLLKTRYEALEEKLKKLMYEFKNTEGSNQSITKHKSPNLYITQDNAKIIIN
jgi:hypothetical protein